MQDFSARSATSGENSENDFMRVDYPQPHMARAKQILTRHPEVKDLFGNHPGSVLHVLAMVAIQTCIAIALKDSPVWLNLAVAYVIGALLNHALWVMIHECSHNLVLKSSAANRAVAILANLPIVFPSAISFQKYHLMHHRYQGELVGDADLPWDWEARWVGHSFLRKVAWLFFFFVIEGIARPIRIKAVKPICRWVVLNNIVEFAYLGALLYFVGWRADLYLFFCSFFSVGLHPTGARWIQEHYVFKPGQETYSYYGPVNYVNYNIGHHNEHHDLPMVAWPNLPKIRRIAPELYDTLYYHTSYSGLLWRFLTDSKVTLFDRVIRQGRAPTSRAPRLSPKAEVIEPSRPMVEAT